MNNIRTISADKIIAAANSHPAPVKTRKWNAVDSKGEVITSAYLATQAGMKEYINILGIDAARIEIAH